MTSETPVTASRRTSLWILDGAVVAAVASGVFHMFNDQGEPGVRFAILAVLVLGIRRRNIPAPFAAAFAMFTLLATWASVHHWYREIAWFDEVVHFLTPGSLAAVAYFLLAELRVMPDLTRSRAHLRPWTPVFWVTLVGVFAAVLWEFYEWIVQQVRPAGMLVGYTDTVLDLAAGTLGSFAAGLLALWWARRHDREAPERR